MDLGYEEKVKMNQGFQNETLDVRTGDGLNDVLLEPLVYLSLNGRLLRAPLGGTTDGLSVPRAVQNIIPATGGDWFSGVLHDSAYRNQLQLFNPDTGEWVRAGLCQHDCDELILEALKSQGVGVVERDTIYRALRLFGATAFEEDRKLPS